MISKPGRVLKGKSNLEVMLVWKKGREEEFPQKILKKQDSGITHTKKSHQKGTQTRWPLCVKRTPHYVVNIIGVRFPEVTGGGESVTEIWVLICLTTYHWSCHEPFRHLSSH